MALSIREADAKRLLWTPLSADQEQQELQQAASAYQLSACACMDKSSGLPAEQSDLLLNGKIASSLTRSCRTGESSRNNLEQLTRRGSSSYEVLLRGMCVTVSGNTDLEGLPRLHPWLLTSRLVLKPDVLLKRRGKGNLVKLNLDWASVQAELRHLLGKEVEYEGLRGPLSHFIVEPFFPHEESTNEYYVALRTLRAGDEVLFSHRGGVDVGDVEAHARRVLIPVVNARTAPAVGAPTGTSQTVIPRAVSALPHITTGAQTEASKAEAAVQGQAGAVRESFEDDAISGVPTSCARKLSQNCFRSGSSSPFDLTYSDNDLVNLFQNADLFHDVVDSEAKELLPRFLVEVYKHFAGMHFAFLEINPFSYDRQNRNFRLLDCAAKLDHTAEFLCDKLWGPITFPGPFGRKFTEAEQYIR